MISLGGWTERSKTVKYRNRNHIFFIWTIGGLVLVGGSLALTASKSLAHRYTQHTGRHTDTVAYESCGKSVSLNFEIVSLSQKYQHILAMS